MNKGTHLSFHTFVLLLEISGPNTRPLLGENDRQYYGGVLLRRTPAASDLICHRWRYKKCVTVSDANGGTEKSVTPKVKIFYFLQDNEF